MTGCDIGLSIAPKYSGRFCATSFFRAQSLLTMPQGQSYKSRCEYLSAIRSKLQEKDSSSVKNSGGQGFEGGYPQ
jgi:hypothetical protein